MVQIGIQQLMLGKKLTSEKEAIKLLSTIKDNGFNGIELNGFMIRKTSLIVKWLTGLSGMPIKNSQSFDWEKIITISKMNVISIHEDLAYLENNLDEAIKQAKKFNTKYFVITGMYKFNYANEEDLGKLIVKLNRLGRELEKQGIDLLYHNHSAEFQHVDYQTISLDYLINGFNPKWVNFEFDSYWASCAGASPLYWLNKLGDRVKLYHICDRGPLKNKASITSIISKMGQKEIGTGVMDLTPLVKKAIQNNVAAIILEQPNNIREKELLKSVRRSVNNIKKMIEE